MMSLPQLQGLEDYLKAVTPTPHKKGEFLYRNEPPRYLYGVSSGAVQLFWREKHVAFAFEGEFFGEECLLGSGDHSSALVITKEAQLMRWSAVDIKSRMEFGHDFKMEILRLFAKHNEQMNESLYASHMQIRDRLAWHLVALAKQVRAAGVEQGSKHYPESVVLPKFFVHQTLSEVVGTSRELITSWLNKFKRDGYVFGTRGTYGVMVQKLEEMLKERHV